MNARIVSQAPDTSTEHVPPLFWKFLDALLNTHTTTPIMHNRGDICSKIWEYKGKCMDIKHLGKYGLMPVMDSLEFKGGNVVK